MELGHHLGGFDIHRVLVAERPFLDPKNEAEGLDMLWKLPQSELNFSVVFEIVKLEGLEITYENVAGKLIFFKTRKVIERLLFGTD